MCTFMALSRHSSFTLPLGKGLYLVVEFWLCRGLQVHTVFAGYPQIQTATAVRSRSQVHVCSVHEVWLGVQVPVLDNTVCSYVSNGGHVSPVFLVLQWYPVTSTSLYLNHGGHLWLAVTTHFQPQPASNVSTTHTAVGPRLVDKPHVREYMKRQEMYIDWYS